MACLNLSDKRGIHHANQDSTRLLAAAIVLQLSLTACNTIKGAGQDMKAAGGALEKKAEEKKRY